MSPLIIELISTLGPAAIKGIISGVERIFGGGTGQQKKATALSTVTAWVNELAKNGKISTLPDQDTLSALVEMFVHTMKADGQLPATQAPFSGTIAVQNGVIVGVK